jgi:hypothetical protein
MSRFIAVAGSSVVVKETLAQAEGWAVTHMGSQSKLSEVQIFELKEPCATVARTEQPYKTTYSPHFQKQIEAPVAEEAAAEAPCSQEQAA